MGGCVGKLKAANGPNPEEPKPADDTKEAVLSSKNGETQIEVEIEDAKINENGEAKGENELYVEVIKDLIPENNELKHEAAAEPEKVTEGKTNGDVKKEEVASA